MSDLMGIGARMVAARSEKKLSQVKIAAMLEISDKSYKNYEAEKREIPSSTAANFCAICGITLDWLIIGKNSFSEERTLSLVTETIDALFSEAQSRAMDLKSPRASKIGRYIAQSAIQKGTNPRDEAGPIFKMFEDE